MTNELLLYPKSRERAGLSAHSHELMPQLTKDLVHALLIRERLFKDWYVFFWRMKTGS